MVNRMVWWVTLALFVALTWIGTTQSARAQYTSGDYGAVITAGGVVGGILGGGQLAFAIGDVVSWARDTPFSSGWAVFEIVYSSVVALADLVFVVGLGLDGGPDVGAIVGVGLAPLALGATNIAHGIWSLATGAREGPAPVSVSLVPTREGLLASASARF